MRTCLFMVILFLLCGCGPSRLEAVMQAVHRDGTTTEIIDLTLDGDGKRCTVILGAWRRTMPVAPGAERDAGLAALREELDLLWDALPKQPGGGDGAREASGAWVKVRANRKLPFQFFTEGITPLLADRFRDGAKPFPKTGLTQYGD